MTTQGGTRTLQDPGEGLAGGYLGVSNSNGQATGHLVALVVGVADGEEGNLDLIKHAPLKEPSEEGHHGGVLVLPRTVVHLQEQGLGQLAVSFLLHALQGALQNLDGQVGVVGHGLSCVVDGGRRLAVDHSDDTMEAQADEGIVLGEFGKVGHTVPHVLTSASVCVCACVCVRVWCVR